MRKPMQRAGFTSNAWGVGQSAAHMVGSTPSAALSGTSHYHITTAAQYMKHWVEPFHHLTLSAHRSQLTRVSGVTTQRASVSISAFLASRSRDHVEGYSVA